MRWRFGWVLPAIVSLACALTLASCARRLPHGIAERYLENLRQFDYAACYALLSQQDRAERTLPEFLTEIPLAPDLSPVWFRPVVTRMQFDFGDEHRNTDGSTATVPVKITMPDLQVWERLLNMTAGSGGVTAEAVQRSLDTDDYPKRIYEDKIFLIKEHHHWRVVAGFAARDQIVDQHRQAMNDYLEQRYDKAIPEWRTMIAALRGQIDGRGDEDGGNARPRDFRNGHQFGKPADRCGGVGSLLVRRPWQEFASDSSRGPFGGAHAGSVYGFYSAGNPADAG